MKVQELFEAKAKYPDAEVEQKRFERETFKPAVEKLLGSTNLRAITHGAAWDKMVDAVKNKKPKRTKRLVWKNEGFDHVYELQLFDVDGSPVVKLEYNDYGGGTDPMFYTVKATKVTEAAGMSPSVLRSAIKKHLKAMGFKAVSEETTSGAMKTWFDQPAGKAPAMRTLFISLKKEFPDQHVMFSGGKVMGDGFNLEPENEGPGIYLAVFTKGSAGQHHKMGLDN